MKCYRYKYNDSSPSTCTGSFDECKELVDCPGESNQVEPICFALAKLDDGYLKYLDSRQHNISSRSASDKPKTIILNAGCYAHDRVGQQCTSNECMGNYRSSAKNYYCCCTETGCNGELIPKLLPPSSNDSQTGSGGASSWASQHTPSTISGSQGSGYSTINQSVMLLAVIIIMIVTVLFGAYRYRRLRLKRHMSSSSSSSGRNSRSGNNNHHHHHHHHAGSRSTNSHRNDNHTDVSMMMPFRNSFNNDDNSNYQYGQQGLHQQQTYRHPNASNSILGDPNSRMNHNTANAPPAGREQNQKFDLKDIKLLEMVGSGRFGTVHRANLIKRARDDNNNQDNKRQDRAGAAGDGGGTGVAAERGDGEIHNESDDANTAEDRQPLMSTSEIAVKIIPNNEYQSWQNELKIYNSSRTRHPNILTFLGSCENPQSQSNWLLVEYASNGSLHHYLKENPITWEEFLSISLGIVRGLSHLHDADIAHRDFKSKNVLLRHNLSPCITDFGVASMLDITGGSHNEQRKKYLQVGTPRYMAPEVLECSVAFTKISFTKIDVYALSLVLWELLSRCHPMPKLRMNDYENSMLSSVSLSRGVGIVESFMVPPPPPPPLLDSSRPTTSTPQKHQHQHGVDSQAAALETETPLMDGIMYAQNNHFHAQGDTFVSSNMDSVDGTTGAAVQHQPHAHYDARQLLQRMLDERNNEVPAYKLPFDDIVGSNPDINAMRQVVVSDKIRPPIRPEWRFYPIAKLCQAIVDGWEYDHDARISASCFVERIETMLQQQQQQEGSTKESRKRDPHERGEQQNSSPAPTNAQGTTMATTATTIMTTPMIATTVT